MSKLNLVTRGIGAVALTATAALAQPSIIARTGDPAPGFEAGSSIIGFGSPVWNASGLAYVLATVEPISDAMPETALYRIDQGQLDLVFRASAGAPGDVVGLHAIAALPDGVGVIASKANDPGGPPTHEHTHGLISDDGFVAFANASDVGSDQAVSGRPFAADGSRLWTLGNGTSLRDAAGELAARGDVAPGADGELFFQFSLPVARQAGVAAFRAVVGPDPDLEPIEQTSREGIWRVIAGQLEAVVVESASVRSLGSPAVNAHGNIAMVARAMTPGEDEGDVVLLARGASVVELGAEGDVTAVGTLKRMLGSVHVGDGGDVFAYATLDGVVADANAGIFAFRTFSSPRPIVVEGDLVPGDAVGRAGMLRVRAITGWRIDDTGGVSALVEVDDVQTGELIGSGLLLADRSGSRRLVALAGQTIGSVSLRSLVLPSAGALSQDSLVAGGSRVPVLVELQDLGQAIIEVDRPCAADLGRSDGDGVDGQVTLADFVLYLDLWLTGDPRADWTTTGNAFARPDGVVDLSDFSVYLSGWSRGCP